MSHQYYKLEQLDNSFTILSSESIPLDDENIQQFIIQKNDDIPSTSSSNIEFLNIKQEPELMLSHEVIEEEEVQEVVEEQAVYAYEITRNERGKWISHKILQFFNFFIIQASLNVPFAMPTSKLSPISSVTFRFMQKSSFLRFRRATMHRKSSTHRPNLLCIHATSARKHSNINGTSRDTSSAVIDIFRISWSAISAALRQTTACSWRSINRDMRRTRSCWNARIVRRYLRRRRIWGHMSSCMWINARNAQRFLRQKVCWRFMRTKCIMRI